MDTVKTRKAQADFEIVNEGSFLAIVPMSEKADTFVKENVFLESWQWLGSAFAVEHRYAFDLLSAAKEQGLTIAPLFGA